GDDIKLADGQIRTVISVKSDTELTIAAKFDPSPEGSTFTVRKANNNPGDFFDINAADGQYVAAMEVYAENLIVWKNKSIFGISGSTANSLLESADPFKITPISNSTGAISQDSVISVKNDIFFLNEYGINALSLV